MQHLSARHTLLLNKFNVVPHHTLVVTRALESQLDALNTDDLGASWEVMQVLSHNPHLTGHCTVCRRECVWNSLINAVLQGRW